MSLDTGLVGTVRFVRHAMPQVEAGVPPEDWELSEQGRAAAHALAAELPPGALLVASAEPKAQQTLAPAGPVLVDDRLGEVRRQEPFDGDFRARRAAYVAGADHDGWEPRSTVAERVDAAMRTALADGRPPVLATHGMALTTWLAARGAVHDPGEFWSGLGLPDLVEVELTGRRARITARRRGSSPSD